MPQTAPSEAKVAAFGEKRILIFCTTYPAPSETFVQREVEAMRKLGLELDVISIWGGGGEGVWRFRFWELAKLLFWLPYWLLLRPAALSDLMQAAILRPMPSALNVGENLLGLGFAVIHAKKIARRGYAHTHAVWGGLPASAAYLLERFIGLPYSIGAHAYDLFEDGGDWLLPEKVESACFVRTSTEAGRRRLLDLQIPDARILRIRRGLVMFPPFHPMRIERSPLRILAVGRFVEKMGYDRLVQILGGARRHGVKFEARLIGDGPTRSRIQHQVNIAGLAGCVSFAGQQPFARVLESLEWADVLVFSGIVARNGDRAGLPNVVAEAMAAGVPVVASRVGGVEEAVSDGESGILAEGEEAAQALRALAVDDALYHRLQEGGRAWAQTNYDACANMRILASAMGLPVEPVLRKCVE